MMVCYWLVAASSSTIEQQGWLHMKQHVYVGLQQIDPAGRAVKDTFKNILK